MDMLGQLLGGGSRQDADDFVRRYDQGAPWDGIGDDEAVERYRQVAPHLPPDQYEESATEAYARLDPDQRRQLGRRLRQGSQERGFALDDLFGGDDDSAYEDPRRLARASGRLEQQQPGILGQLLGGGSGGGSGGGLLGSPIGKAALAGVAAMAMKRFMGGR
jgi:hypothetical protein